MQTYFRSSFSSLHILPCLTFSLICGIMWIHYQGTWLQGSAILVGITIFVYKCSFPILEKKRYNILLALLAFLSGLSQYKTKSSTFDTFFSTCSHIISLKGEVLSIEQCYNKQFNYIVTIKTHDIQSSAFQSQTNHYLHIYTCKNPPCEIGDIILLEDINLKKPSNAEFLLYLKKESVSGTLFLPHLSCRILYHPSTSLKRIISIYKNNLTASLQNKLSPLAFSLFLTIFLGKKSSYKYPIRQTCKVWGISHYLARSGLHLILFMVLLKILVSITCIGYRLQTIILIVLGNIYYILSWPSVSFNRAFFAFILEKLATLTLISMPSCHILNLVCFFTLFNNPYHLFFLDFQLSFSLAFTITYFNELFRQKEYTHLKTPHLY